MKKSKFLVRGMLGVIFFVLRGSVRCLHFVLRYYLLFSKGFALPSFKMERKSLLLVT